MDNHTNKINVFRSLGQEVSFETLTVEQSHIYDWEDAIYDKMVL